MTTKAGFPTGMIYFFTRMIKKLVDEYKPEYLYSVIDAPGETFRERLYPSYKANRKGMKPDDLIRQLPYVERLIELYHFPQAEIGFVEADDVIGTLAKQFYEKYPDHQIYIVTGDKDMFQLVNDRTFIINPMKDLFADAAKVEEIVGVPPAQVVDVMALRGDSVDNVPGAPGIGKKGSVDIIRQFGTLEKALDGAAEIKRKTYRESLQNNREQILLSKQLVTIATDVEVMGDLSDLQLSEPDVTGLTELYRELEFASLLKKEQMSLIEDFAEIVQPEPPAKTDIRSSLSDEDADRIMDSIL
jgi:DNA polymerase I